MIMVAIDWTSLLAVLDSRIQQQEWSPKIYYLQRFLQGKESFCNHHVPKCGERAALMGGQGKYSTGSFFLAACCVVGGVREIPLLCIFHLQ